MSRRSKTRKPEAMYPDRKPTHEVDSCLFDPKPDPVTVKLSWVQLQLKELQGATDLFRSMLNPAENRLKQDAVAMFILGFGSVFGLVAIVAPSWPALGVYLVCMQTVVLPQRAIQQLAISLACGLFVWNKLTRMLPGK